MGSAGMISQDGTKMAFNRLGFRDWRKHYRGNNNTDIWIQDLKTLDIRRRLRFIRKTEFSTPPSVPRERRLSMRMSLNSGSMI